MSALEHYQLSLGVIPRSITPGNMIPRAAELARFTTVEEVRNPLVLGGLRDSRRLTQHAIQHTFGVEIDLITTLKRKLVIIDSEIRRIEHADIGLPIIDPSFLSWKTNGGYPAFSIYSLDNPECKITYDRGWGMGRKVTLDLTPVTHPLIEKHYLDENMRVLFEAEADAEGLSRIQLTARYNGAMPANVRDNVQQYVQEDPKYRFEKICIVAEAPEWQRNTVATIAVGDPLVIGIAHGHLWLIDKYDLTPVERLAQELCTPNPKKANN